MQLIEKIAGSVQAAKLTAGHVLRTKGGLLGQVIRKAKREVPGFRSGFDKARTGVPTPVRTTPKKRATMTSPSGY